MSSKKGGEESSDGNTVLLRVLLSHRVSKALMVKRDATVAECREGVLKKLCRETFGSLKDDNFEVIKERFHMFDLHRMYADNEAYLILLQPHDPAVYYTEAGSKTPDVLLFSINFYRAQNDQISLLKEQLLHEEAKMYSVMQSYSEAKARGSSDGKLALLWDAIDEQRATVRSVSDDIARIDRQNTGIDGHGTLAYQDGDAQQPLFFWFRLIEGNLCIFLKKEDSEPYGVIPLKRGKAKVVYHPKAPKGFVLQVEQMKERIDYVIATDSEEMAWSWMRSLSNVIGESIATESSKAKFNKTRNHILRGRRRATVMSHARAYANVVKSRLMKETYRSNFSVLRKFKSRGLACSVVLDDGSKDERKILRGSAEDILAAIFLACTEEGKENIELRDFLLDYFNYLDAELFASTIRDTWKVLEDAGFPVVGNRGATNLLRNFVVQVLQSPHVVYDGTSDELLRSKLVEFAAPLVPDVAFPSISFNPLPPLRFDEMVITDKTSIFGFSSSALAGQLTIRELTFFREMRSSEFLENRWQKDKHLAPNIVELSKNFNRVVRMVTTMVLSADSSKQASQRYKKLLHTANHLFKMRNYNSCFQVLSGLTHSAVARQKCIISLLGNEKYKRMFDKLNKAMSYNNNFKAYRELSHDAPCIPLMLVMLRDIVYFQDGKPAFLSGNQVNFSRIQDTANAIFSIGVNMHEATNYVTLRFCPALDQLLAKAPVYTDEEIYERADQLSGIPRVGPVLEAAETSSMEDIEEKATAKRKAEGAGTPEEEGAPEGLMEVLVEELQAEVDRLSEWRSKCVCVASESVPTPRRSSVMARRESLDGSKPSYEELEALLEEALVENSKLQRVIDCLERRYSRPHPQAMSRSNVRTIKLMGSSPRVGRAERAETRHRRRTAVSGLFETPSAPLIAQEDEKAEPISARMPCVKLPDVIPFTDSDSDPSLSMRSSDAEDEATDSDVSDTEEEETDARSVADTRAERQELDAEECDIRRTASSPDPDVPRGAVTESCAPVADGTSELSGSGRLLSQEQGAARLAEAGDGDTGVSDSLNVGEVEVELAETLCVQLGELEHGESGQEVKDGADALQTQGKGDDGQVTPPLSPRRKLVNILAKRQTTLAAIRSETTPGRTRSTQKPSRNAVVVPPIAASPDAVPVPLRPACQKLRSPMPGSASPPTPFVRRPSAGTRRELGLGTPGRHRSPSQDQSS